MPDESYEQILDQAESLVKSGADDETWKAFGDKCWRYRWNNITLDEFTEHFDRLVDLMVLVAHKYPRDSTDETEASRDAISCRFLKGIRNPLEKYLEENPDLAAESSPSKGWGKVFETIYSTGSPALIDDLYFAFSNDDLFPFKELPVPVMTHLLKVICDSTHLLSIKIPTKGDTQELHIYNSLVTHFIGEMIESFSEDRERLSPEVVELIQRLFKTCAENMKESPYMPAQRKKKDKDLHVYSMFYLTIVSRICMEYMDVGFQMLPILEMMVSCQDENIALLCNTCIGNINREKGDSLGTDSVKRQVERYIQNPSTDQQGSIPDLVLQSYKKDPDMVKSVLPTLAGLIPTLEGVENVLHKYKIILMIKSLAEQDPELITDDILNVIYTCGSDQSLAYFASEILAVVTKFKPERINIESMCQFTTAAPLYIYKTTECFNDIGSHPSCSAERAAEIFGWLIPQLMNPLWTGNRAVMLKCAAVIGVPHKNQLLPYKALIEQLAEDPRISIEARALLDQLEQRTLAGVSKDIEYQAARTENIESEVIEVKDTVQKTNERVDGQQKHLKNITLKVLHTEAELKSLEERFDGAVSEIERIDRKTVDSTPTWAHDVSKLMDEEGERDWRLLALRLGYKGEQLESWASHSSPCMSLLNEWFATHISSEATRAVYIVLHELDRDDAATFVENSIKKAGELIPVDEPISVTDPPSVFISYQWGVQQQAIALKNWLSECGFTCWLDIGQMGGGDKLYEKIDNGIRSAKIVLSLVTEKYAVSANCNKEVNLSVSLGKPLIPLLMEKMSWPPAGSLGPLFGEYIFIRFFQRDAEKNDKFYWPEMKMVELIMQIMYHVKPEAKLISKVKDNWWKKLNGTSIITNTIVENPEIFISYQWGKQKQVHELYQKLSTLGYTCWLDIKQMGGGDSLYDKIDKGLRNCKVMISCVTEKYAISTNCRRELSLADNINKTVIPLKLDDSVWPPSGPMGMILTQKSYLNMNTSDSLTKGDNLNMLLILLSQHGVVSSKKYDKFSAYAPLTAANKFKRPNKDGKSPKSEKTSKVPTPPMESAADESSQEKPKATKGFQGDPQETKSKACNIL